MPWGLISGEKRLDIVKRPLISALLFFIFGIISGRVLLSYNYYVYFPLIILLICILIISFISRRPYLRLFYFFIIFFLIGAVFFLRTTIKSTPGLLEITRGQKKVVLQGTVLTPGSITQERARFDILVEAVFLDQDVIPTREKVAVTIYNNIIDIFPGQSIRFPASLKPFNNFNNPGRYDYETSMRLRGFSCRASVSDGRYIVPMGTGDLGPFMKVMEAVRGPIREFINSNLSPRNKEIYRALILGESQGIGNDLRESFNVTGLGHVLAVSGLHVGLVAVVSFAFFRFLLSLSYGLTLRMDIRKITAIITCLCVFAYTFIAGFHVSAKRAMIMAITYLLSIVLGREKDPWSTLALAAFIVLALDPNDLFTISFHLSFAAVIGIFWLSPEIYRLIKAASDELKRGSVLSRAYLYFSSLLVITLSAVIFLMPITTYYFHRISIVAVPINLIVQPFLGLWILPVGLLSIVFLPVSYSLSRLILKIGSYGLDWMMNIIQYWSQFNWASFWSLTPNLFEIGLCYGIIIFSIFALKKRTWAKRGLLVVLIIGAFDISYWVYETRFNRDLRVTFIDVGQGNSALVQFPGKERLLLDGGGFLSGSYDTGRSVVAPFLLHSKICRIDYIVLSHPHPDHLNGLIFIAEHFNPKEFWYNGQDVETPEFIKLIETIQRNNIKVLLPDDMLKGREISGARVELFHPMTSDKSWSDGKARDSKVLNNNSLVLKITYRGKSFLFPGDIEEEGERAVASNWGSSLESDVLLAGHHGSKTSSTVPFLQAVSPEITVISCGKGNSFGFPHAEAIQRLKDIGSEIIGIDESGAVQIRVDKDGLRIKKFIR